MQKVKKSLLLSICCLVLSLTMLVGTTFAWFTDSVTSGNNKIVAGSLKIDLVMDKEQNGTYVSIAGEEGAIFGGENSLIAQNKSSDTLWEPGKTQVVFLGVKNLGTLSAKYKIKLTVTDNGLADALEYAIVDGAKATDLSAVTSWTEIQALTGVQTGSLGDYEYDATTNQATVTAAEGGVLDEGTGETQYFALAVHMMESTGNTYMNKDVVIDVLVEAIQCTAESDSFDNQYDKDAGKTEDETTEYALWLNIDAIMDYYIDNELIEEEEKADSYALVHMVVESVEFTNKQLSESDKDKYDIEWDAPLNTKAYLDVDTNSLVYTFEGDTLKFDDNTMFSFGAQKLSDEQYLEAYNKYIAGSRRFKKADTIDDVYKNFDTDKIYGENDEYLKRMAKTALSQIYSCSDVTSIKGLEYFDVSDVTDFSSVFQLEDYESDTLDISTWNTKKAETMAAMFKDLSVKEIKLGENWGTSNVIDMSTMFGGCNELTTINLSGWNVGKVKDMSSMFEGCEKLEGLEEVEKWNVSVLENANALFKSCKQIGDLDLTGWNMSNVTILKTMFANSSITSLDISTWDTSKVICANAMFNRCSNLQHIYVGDGWTMEGITNETDANNNSENMFFGASQLPNYDSSDFSQNKKFAHTGTGGYLETKN